jgi:hypothetical protein
MNPRFIFLIVVLLIVAGAIVYVLYFMPKSDETTVLGPFVLNGIPSEADSSGSKLESVLTARQLSTSLKSNFTISFFIYMDKLNMERIPFAGPEGEYRFKPLVKLIGVGEFVLNPVHQRALLRLTPLVPSVMNGKFKTPPYAEITNVMNSRWNQITITLEGRSIDIYLNSKHATSLILENLTWTNPTGMLLETSPDFWGQAGMIQAWPRRLTESEIVENYKRVTDLRGKPNIPDAKPTFKSIWQELYKLMCKAGFCPNSGKGSQGRLRTNGLEYVDYEYA